MRCIKGIFWLAVIALVAGVIVMFSGVIDVAATNPHNPVTAFVLSTSMDNSVRYHAKGIEAPSLEDPGMIREGFSHYREMCLECHLAPGVDSTEIRQGLLPEPPTLQEATTEWKPAELFWIIKNGVKLTGMPAWGPTHSDDKIWAIVAFLEKMAQMSAEQYREMDRLVAPVPDEDAHAGHDHHP